MRVLIACEFGKHEWRWCSYPVQVRCSICREFKFCDCHWMDTRGLMGFMGKLKKSGKIL